MIEHEFKIANLENQIKNIAPESQPLSEVMKNILIKEYMHGIDYMLHDFSDASMQRKLNLVDYKFVEKNGENVFQLYFDDDYDWVLDSSTPMWSAGPAGRVFTMNFSKKFNDINEFYGVKAKVEFYEHGEQIKTFIK